MEFSLVLLLAVVKNNMSEVVQRVNNFCQLHSLILPFRLSVLLCCLSICFALQAVRLCHADNNVSKMQEMATTTEQSIQSSTDDKPHLNDNTKR